MQLLDIVTKNSTDRSVTIRIIDSATGLPETAVEHNTSGIDLWYRREGAAKTSITEAALSALTDAHSDGGIEHIGDGYYRLDLPDAAFATGANHVDIGGTVTDMIVLGGRVRLVNYSLEDSVRMGLTALPNAAADAAGGLPISDAGGLDLDGLDSTVTGISSDTDAILATLGTNGDGLTDIPSVASVTGAVGSVTGNVGGNVTGSVGSVLGGINTGAGTITTLDGLDTAQDTQHGTTQSAISALNNLSAAQVNAEVDTALADIHLDHLFATDYDPASKPGTSTALLNELIGNDAGVSQFTANALELAPGGGGGGDATAANQSTIITHLTDIKGSGWVTADNLAEIAEDVAGLNGDAMRGTDSAYTGTPPTVGQIADGVWTEQIGDHSATSGSTAESLAAAGGSGDPWVTTLPGSYTGSQAGKILADILTDTAAIPSFPANFALLGINGSGHVSRVTLTDSATVVTGGINTAAGTITTLDALDTAQDNQHAFTQSALSTNQATLLGVFPTNFTDLAITETTGRVTVGTNADKTGYSLSTAPPTAAAIRAEIDSNSTQLAAIVAVTDKVDTALEDDGSSGWQFTTLALENAPAGGGGGGDASLANQTIIIGHLTDIKGATFDDSTDSLEAIRDRGDAAWITGDGGVVGPGAIEHTITVLSEGDPVDGAQVWVTLDEAGTQVIAGALTTDAFGQAVFMLDAGTFYQWAQKTGVNFDNPSSFVVA